MGKEDLIEKLEALSKSPNEHEAKAAKIKAEELRKKYNIPKFEETTTTATHTTHTTHTTHSNFEEIIIWTFGGNRKNWIIDLANGLCEKNNCIGLEYNYCIYALGPGEKIKHVKVLLEKAVKKIEKACKGKGNDSRLNAVDDLLNKIPEEKAGFWDVVRKELIEWAIRKHNI